MFREAFASPQQNYSRLYDVRNSIMHGNPMPGGRVERRRREDWMPLFFAAPLLYRNLLLHRLSEGGYDQFPRRMSLRNGLAHVAEDIQQRSFWERPMIRKLERRGDE